MGSMEGDSDGPVHNVSPGLNFSDDSKPWLEPGLNGLVIVRLTGLDAISRHKSKSFQATSKISGCIDFDFDKAMVFCNRSGRLFEVRQATDHRNRTPMGQTGPGVKGAAAEEWAALNH